MCVFPNTRRRMPPTILSWLDRFISVTRRPPCPIPPPWRSHICSASPKNWISRTDGLKTARWRSSKSRCSLESPFRLMNTCWTKPWEQSGRSGRDTSTHLARPPSQCSSTAGKIHHTGVHATCGRVRPHWRWTLDDVLFMSDLSNTHQFVLLFLKLITKRSKIISKMIFFDVVRGCMCVIVYTWSDIVACCFSTVFCSDCETVKL